MCIRDRAYGGAFGLGAVTQYVGAATNFFVGIGGLFTAVGDLSLIHISSPTP